MLTIDELQRRLAAAGRYKGKVDNDFGPLSTVALMASFQNSERTDLVSRRRRVKLNVPVGFLGMVERRPFIDFNPKRFEQLSGRPQPFKIATVKELTGQRMEWRKLAEACETDPQAAFEATSWGLCRTPGHYWREAGFKSVWEFARAHVGGEDRQVRIVTKIRKRLQ